ncbi:hypothetical protein [Demequina aurantiaca]|uniref:hypothetical protein n=1 Tax=Demequina aurantiaca TaxID=676200 RepID=UPI003D3327A7
MLIPNSESKLSDYEPVDQRGLINFVAAHVVGSRAVVQVRGEREVLLMGLAAGTNSAALHQSVERFALSFADESVFGAAARRGWASNIRRIDASSCDHLLPDNMRPTD